MGFVTSPRLLAFWAIAFTMGMFALTLFLACASLMRKIPTANALQVGGPSAQALQICMPFHPVCEISAAPRAGLSLRYLRSLA